MKIASIAALAALIAAAVAFAGVGRPGQARGSAAQPGRTITVEGVGTVRGVPDTAHVTFGVETHGATAQEALAAAGGKMRRILVALKQAGVEKADLQTQDVSVYPHQESSGPDGFDASSSVAATVRAVSRTGKVIDAAVAAGADETSGPSFDRSSRSSLTERALRDAFQNARAKAAALAQETGGQLGELQRVDENGQAAQPEPYFRAMVLDQAKTPIARGTQTVQASVTATFTLG
jgi:uncharacterized protein